MGMRGVHPWFAIVVTTGDKWDILGLNFFVITRDESPMSRLPIEIPSYYPISHLNSKFPAIYRSAFFFWRKRKVSLQRMKKKEKGMEEKKK